MIETLLSPDHARRQPWQVFFLAVLFVSLAIVISIAVPSIQGGVVTLAMVPSIPLIWTLLVREEKHEDVETLKRDSWRYHLPLLKVFVFFFLGASVAYGIWFAALPTDTAKAVFSPQLEELRAIRQVSAGAMATGQVIQSDVAIALFSHNAVVLGFMFIFTLIYGIGAIYLLLWNASIIGVFIGARIAAAPHAGVISALSILPHGSLEIGAYFLATMAGGILSAGLMRRTYQSPAFKIVILDVVLLSFVSVAMLALAAVLESIA